MNIFTAIFQFVATIFSPLRHPGGRGAAVASDDLAGVEAKARYKRMLAAVAVVVIVGSLVSLYFTMTPPTPKINRAPFIAIGEVLAEETAKAIHDRGRITIVIADYHKQRGTMTNDQFKQFRATLKKHAGIEIVATEVVVTDETAATPGLTVKTFDELLKKHANVNGIVCFVGLPDLGQLPDAHVSAKHPKLIAVQTGASSVKQYFELGIADTLIVSRMNTGPADETVPQNLRGWFNKYFEVFTTANYQAMP